MRGRSVAIGMMCTCWLTADVVTLKNGDRVTGKVVRKDGGRLTFRADLLGEVTIAWEAVAALESDQALNVVLPTGRTVTGPIKTRESGIEVAAPAGAAQVTLAEVGAIRDAAEQRRYERLLDPGWKELWAGYVDLGYSIARGNARTNTLTTAVNAARVTNRDKASVYFNQIYSTATINRVGAATAQAVRGGWSYNHNINPRLFYSFFNDYEYDRFQNLDLRFVAGSGLGFIAVRNERLRLDLPAGAGYNRESFSTPLVRNSAEAYWGDEMTFRVNDRTNIRQAFRMFHNLQTSGAYRINFDLGLATQLRKWLAWQATTSDRFLSNPVAGRQRNDIIVTTGFRVTFAR